MPRKAARRDANEAEIVAALEAVGASVYRIDADGFPDLVVGFRGVNVLMEVKSKTGMLTKSQVQFFAHWQGMAHIVRDVDDAIAIVNEIEG